MPKQFIKERPILFISLTAILILLGFSRSIYQFFMGPADEMSMPQQVQTVRVKAAPMPDLIETIGTLTAKEEITVKAGGPGKVQRILVESGSYVKEGTLLANIIAAPEIRAPFDGYLTDWIVKAGEYVKDGTPLIDLVNTDLLSLTYRVPESYSSRLAVDQPVEVTVKAFPTETFQGIVTYVSPVVDRKTYTILVRATVKNEQQNLWPGMSAHVRHILATHADALVIPESCLILTLEGYNVFVVSNGKIERRVVTIGTRHQGRAHIVSGLTLGDSVVLVRTNFIAEGADAVANDWTGDW